MNTTITHSQRLRAAIALTSGSLSARIHDFWSHPRLAEFYPEFLFALYGVVVASAPLIRDAALEAAKLTDTDPIARQLAPYLKEHADEEVGHDEWLLDDLRTLGFEHSRTVSRLPYTSVSNLVGAQYFLVRHVHPVAILGYLAVLENPASPAFLEAIASGTGLPLEAMSTLLRHARLDEGHVAEFDLMLDELPLSDKQRDIMTTSAIVTVANLEKFFADILEHFNRFGDAPRTDQIFHRASGIGLSGAASQFAVV